jgi:hypothetical protein
MIPSSSSLLDLASNQTTTLQEKAGLIHQSGF